MYVKVIKKNIMIYSLIISVSLTFFAVFNLYGADIDEKLLKAVADGRIYEVQALIDADAEVNASNRWGRTALVCVSDKNENLRIVKILLYAGADVNAVSDLGTALVVAAREDQVEIVRALLEAGADVNAEDQFGYSALFYASYQGYSEIMQLLRNAGAIEPFQKE